MSVVKASPVAFELANGVVARLIASVDNRRLRLSRAAHRAT
jgi:hypothetical protein